MNDEFDYSSRNKGVCPKSTERNYIVYDKDSLEERDEKVI